MSIDIAYYSFNPSRADQGWKNFASDIGPLIAYNTEERNKREQSEKRWAGRQNSWELIYEPRLSDKRKEIFKRYEEENLYIPGIKWSEEQGVKQDGASFYATEKEKMEYLLLYGPLYPQGHYKGGAVDPKFMYIDDKEEYQNLETKLKTEWETDNDSAGEAGNSTIQLTERQKALNDGPSLNFTYGKTIDEESVLEDLVGIDLFYGSTSNHDLPESASQYDPVLEEYGLLGGQQNQEFKGDLETWVKIYDQLNAETIHSHAMSMDKQTGWGTEECGQYIREFFQGMKGIIKDVKEGPNTVLVREVAGSGEVEPESANTLLQQRAQQHLKEYRNLIVTKSGS